MLPHVSGRLPARLVIASRESILALWQARYIESRLVELYPHLKVSILGMTTEGDRTLGTSLAKIGGKGLFVKELEQAIKDGRADIAVHSLKDVPMHLPESFTLGAILARADPRDAFVSIKFATLAALPAAEPSFAIGSFGLPGIARRGSLRHLADPKIGYTCDLSRGVEQPGSSLGS